LPVVLLLLLLSFSDTKAQHLQQKFSWSPYLKAQVLEAYGDSMYFYHRLAQTYCESGFNPRATSDFTGWKRTRLDTVSAIRKRKGAAGLCQFIYPTAERYGAISINTKAAAETSLTPDIYNPFWSLKALCAYMKNIGRTLAMTKNMKARRALMTDRRFNELVSTASYNTGEGRILDRLNKFGSNWEKIKYSILPEPRNYAERIYSIATAEQEGP